MANNNTAANLFISEYEKWNQENQLELSFQYEKYIEIPNIAIVLQFYFENNKKFLIWCPIDYPNVTTFRFSKAHNYQIIFDWKKLNEELINLETSSTISFKNVLDLFAQKIVEATEDYKFHLSNSVPKGEMPPIIKILNPSYKDLMDKYTNKNVEHKKNKIDKIWALYRKEQETLKKSKELSSALITAMIEINLCPMENLGIEVLPEDEDVFDLIVKFSNFNPESGLGKDLEHLKENGGSDIVELRLNFTDLTYPAFPPKVSSLEPRLVGPNSKSAFFLGALSPLKSTKNTMLYNIIKVKAFFEKYLRVDFESISEPKEDCYYKLENILVNLEMFTHTEPRLAMTEEYNTLELSTEEKRVMNFQVKHSSSLLKYIRKKNVPLYHQHTLLTDFDSRSHTDSVPANRSALISELLEEILDILASTIKKSKESFQWFSEVIENSCLMPYLVSFIETNNLLDVSFSMEVFDSVKKLTHLFMLHEEFSPYLFTIYGSNSFFSAFSNLSKEAEVFRKNVERSLSIVDGASESKNKKKESVSFLENCIRQLSKSLPKKDAKAKSSFFKNDHFSPKAATSKSAYQPLETKSETSMLNSILMGVAGQKSDVESSPVKASSPGKKKAKDMKSPKSHSSPKLPKFSDLPGTSHGSSFSIDLLNGTFLEKEVKDFEYSLPLSKMHTSWTKLPTELDLISKTIKMSSSVNSSSSKPLITQLEATQSPKPEIDNALKPYLNVIKLLPSSQNPFVQLPKTPSFSHYKDSDQYWEMVEMAETLDSFSPGLSLTKYSNEESPKSAPKDNKEASVDLVAATKDVKKDGTNSAYQTSTKLLNKLAENIDQLKNEYCMSNDYEEHDYSFEEEISDDPPSFLLGSEWPKSSSASEEDNSNIESLTEEIILMQKKLEEKHEWYAKTIQMTTQIEENLTVQPESNETFQLESKVQTFEEVYKNMLSPFLYQMVEFSCFVESPLGRTRNQILRLSHEQSSLSSSLPLTLSSSIFVRVDDADLTKMKAMITGPEGTPYSNGMYFFDIFCTKDYPNQPPEVKYLMPGKKHYNKINPNLYKDGKVCLSLLNTWMGNASEKWSSKCTILQVLISIQSLVLVPDPYYNEPAYEVQRGTPKGIDASNAYNRRVKAHCIEYAILDVLKNPPKEFESVIKSHIYLKKGQILMEAEKFYESLNVSSKETLYLKNLQETLSAMQAPTPELVEHKF